MLELKYQRMQKSFQTNSEGENIKKSDEKTITIKERQEMKVTEEIKGKGKKKMEENQKNTSSSSSPEPSSASAQDNQKSSQTLFPEGFINKKEKKNKSKSKKK